MNPPAVNPLVHEYTMTLPATPERVFAALTDPAQLRAWFAEQVDVEPKVGGAYRFWGRYSYSTPTRAEATQTLTAFDPGRELAYAWHFGGRDSTVTLSLAAKDDDAGSTVFKVRHEFAQAPQMVRAKEMVDDLWRLLVVNLHQYLATGKPALLPDFTDPKPEIHLSILINAPREKVFRSLLDPELMNRWLGGKANVDPRIGGQLSYGWHYKVGEREVDGGPTRIIDMVENERLVTDWPDWRGDPEVPPTTVTWLLASEGAQTRLTLIHGVFPRAADMSDYPYGWLGFLDGLKGVAEAD